MLASDGPAAPATWAAPGPTAGVAGEHIAIVAYQDRKCHLRVTSIENQMNEFERSATWQNRASWAAIPDLVVTGWRGNDLRQFGTNVKGVQSLRENPLMFTAPDSSVRGAIQFSVMVHLWCVLTCVSWGGQDIRVITPQQVMAQGDYNCEKSYWWFDVSCMPTIDDWLDNMPSYDGGGLALARPPALQPVLPPNVIQLPRAA